MAHWFAHPTPARGLSMLFQAGIVLTHSRHAEDHAWIAEQLGAVSRRQGQLTLAAGWFAQVEATLPSQQRRRKTMAALGQAQSLISSDPARAGEQLRRAALQAERLQMPFAVAVAAQDRCMALRHQGQIGAAIECYPGASAGLAALGEWNEVLRTELNLAHALVQAGELLRARNTLEAAAERAVEDLQPGLQARVLGARARYATWAGDFETAFALLTRAITIYGDRHPLERAQATASLADTYALAGQSHRAQGLYRESIATLRRIGASHELESTILRLARLQHALGRQDAARASLALLEGADAGLQTIDRLQTQLDHARLWLLAGDRKRARRLIEPLREPVSELGLWLLQARLLAVDATLAGNAAEELEPQLRQTAEQARRQGQLLLYLDLQTARLQLAQRVNDDRTTREIAGQTLRRGRRVVAATRSPELRRTVMVGLRPFASARLPALPEGPVAEPQVRWALAPIEDLRGLARQTTTLDADGEALAQLEHLLSVELLAESAAPREASDRARLNALIDRQPAAPDDELLPPLRGTWARTDAATVWLYPVFAGDALHLLWRDRHGWTHVRTDAAQMREAVAEVARLLRDGHSSRQDLHASLQRIATGIDWTSHVDAGTEHLVVVAESELSMLPWELLSWHPTDAAAPRLTVVQSLEDAPRPGGNQRLHRVFSDPGTGSSLAELPDASRELEQVAEAWRDRLPIAEVVRDREGLLQALAAPGALVHVASHAQRGEGLPEDAGLWLGQHGRPEFISALRLRRSAIQASLVVLNACDSGDLASSQQPGIGGLAGSLLDADAGAVVATRWPISDRSARLFAQRFHRALADTPDDAALALQRAARAMRHERAMQHPSAWAAWVLLRAAPSPPP